MEGEGSATVVVRRVKVVLRIWGHSVRPLFARAHESLLTARNVSVLVVQVVCHLWTSVRRLGRLLEVNLP